MVGGKQAHRHATRSRKRSFPRLPIPRHRRGRRPFLFANLCRMSERRPDVRGGSGELVRGPGAHSPIWRGMDPQKRTEFQASHGHLRRHSCDGHGTTREMGTRQPLLGVARHAEGVFVHVLNFSAAWGIADPCHTLDVHARDSAGIRSHHAVLASLCDSPGNIDGFLARSLLQPTLSTTSLLVLLDLAFFQKDCLRNASLRGAVEHSNSGLAVQCVPGVSQQTQRIRIN